MTLEYNLFMGLIKRLFILLLLFTSLYAKEKVSLQLLWKHQFEFAGYYMAKEKGFYDEVDLDVEFKEYKRGTNITKDVEDGISTYGINYPKMILDYTNGSKIVFLNALLQTSPNVLVTLESSGIKSIKDFKNKKVMIYNSDKVDHAAIRAMINSQGVTINDFTLLSDDYRIKTLLDGTADIKAAFLSNEIYLLKRKNIKYKIWNPKDYGFDFYDDILFTSKKELNENPGRIQRFQKASLKGWEYAFANIDETIKVIKEKYNSQNKSVEYLRYEANVLKKLAYYETDKVGKLDKNKIQRIFDVYNLMGLTKQNLDLKQAVFTNTTDGIILSQEQNEYLKNNKTIKMCNNLAWAPIEFMPNFLDDNNLEKHSNIQGISIDTLKILEKKLNIKFEHIHTNNLEEAKRFLQEGKCDILPATINTKEANNYANFTKPYLNYELAIITQSNHPFISNIEELLSKKMVIKKESELSEKLANRYKNINIEEVNNIKTAFLNLSTNKADYTISTLPVASYYITRLGLNNLQVSGYMDMTCDISIAVNKDNLILKDILDKGLQSITWNEKKEISQRWTKNLLKETGEFKYLWETISVIFIIIALLLYRQYILGKYNKELKDTKKRLEVSLKEIHHILNTTLEAIIVIKDDICIEANHESLKLFNLKNKDDILGKKTFDFIADQSIELVKENLQSNNNEPFEVVGKRSDSSFFPIILKAQKINTSMSGEVTLLCVLDLTELKEKDKLISEQSKMAAMGEMIGNIAHQWRQPLSVISVSASGIKLKSEMKLLKEEELRESADNIVRSTQYLSQTIDDFRDFIKGSKTTKEFNLTNNINKTISLLEGMIKANAIEITLDLDNNIDLINYENELNQAIINILNNAKDALVSNKIVDKLICIKTYKDGNSIVISIIDNANGINKEIIDKIFEPYFTTKHKSQGTGLGLYMTHKIITESMNGKIEVLNKSYTYKDKEYIGANFKIILPIKKG